MQNRVRQRGMTAGKTMSMKAKSPSPKAESDPVPTEKSIVPRWRGLLKHAYFMAPPALPPSAQRRQRLEMATSSVAASSLEEQRIQKRWEGTTPQGREIIRKKLFALKEELLEAITEEQFEILRRLTPGYLKLMDLRKSSSATWNQLCAASVDELVRSGGAETCIEAAKQLSATYPKDPWFPLSETPDEEVDFWESLALEVTNRVSRPNLLGPSK
jgi:hypothetical protein